MDNIKVHDFEKSKKYSPSQIRFLTTYIESFAKASNLQLQYELKNKCNMKMALKEVYQEPYGEFLEKVDYDSTIIDFNIEEEVKNLVFNLDKKVSMTIIDCLLGSNGNVNTEKELTEIDKEILNYIINALFKKTTDYIDMKDLYINEIYMNKAQYTNASSKGSAFIALLEFYLNNEVVGNLKVCLPFESLENVIDKIMAKNSDNNSVETNENIINTQILNAMFEKQITLDVIAELGSMDLTVGELLSLEPGDAFMLDKKIDEDIEIFVGGERAYIGKPGKVASNNAIIIVNSIEGEKISNERENE